MEISTLIERMLPFVTSVRNSLNFSIPKEVLNDAPWVGAVLLFGALVTGMFGAKLARGAITVALGAAGLTLGYRLGQHFNVPPVGGGLLGLGVLAMVGYLTHRMWVGASVGALFGAVAMLLLGGQPLWQSLQNFPPAVVAPAGEFRLPNAQAAPEPIRVSLATRSSQFVEQFRTEHPRLYTQVLAVGGVAIAAGFCWGTWYTRGALIVACAFIGTTLLGASLSAFAEAFAPAGWEERVARHPQMTLAFVLCAFLLSNLVQYRFTQPPKGSGPGSGEPKSA